MWVSYWVFVTYLPSTNIFHGGSIVFCYHKSWVVFSLRYECYFVSESAAVAENWKYLGNASYIIRKKYHRKSGPWWYWCKHYIESPYFRTNRGNESDTRISVRVTFTLQRCYRISRRRCNRRCNLCLILSAHLHMV